MANATARVARDFRSVKQENITHSWGTLSAALQTYVNAMVGLNAGYLAKFDDTASMRFFGKARMRFSNSRLASSLIAALPCRAPP